MIIRFFVASFVINLIVLTIASMVRGYRPSDMIVDPLLSLASTVFVMIVVLVAKWVVSGNKKLTD